MSVSCTQVIKISILDILGVCYCNLYDITWSVRIYAHETKVIVHSYSYNTIKTSMQDGDTKVDLGAGKHTLAASCAGSLKKV